MSKNSALPKKAGRKLHYSEPKQLHGSYQLADSVDIQFPVHKICLLGEEFWCAAGRDGVIVYSLQGDILKQIQNEHIEVVLGLAEISAGGDIVVSDRYKGLQCLDRQGKMRGNVTEGNYCDVSVCQNVIYALEFQRSRVVAIVQDSEKNWLVTKEFPLEYGQGNVTDKVCATTHGIYVSSYKTNSIYQYSLDGKFEHKMGEFGEDQPGKFQFPDVSEADSLGNILVRDYDNRCLQMLDIAKGEWQIILSTKHPPTATAIGLNDIWVLTNASRKLHQYTKA